MKLPSSQNLTHLNAAFIKKFVITCFCLNSILCYSQSPRTISSKIHKVTVYLQGANLFYSENLNLQPGNNEIIFENISPNIQAPSLQASSKGALVMDIKHQVKYKEKKIATYKYDKEIENALDSIENIDYELKDIDNKTYVLETEKNMLLNNRIIKGQPVRDSLPLLRDGMSFLKEKLNAIYEQSLKLEKSRNKLTKLKNKLNTRYATLQLLQNGQSGIDYTNAQVINQVVLTVYSEIATSATVSFNYYVSTANWIPVYDLQATSATNNFQLKYFANVTQSSGLDWNNVPLTISTSNPNESNIKPELNPWYLSFAEYRRKEYEKMGISNTSKPLSSQSFESLDNKRITQDDVNQDKFYVENYIQVMENIIRTEYQIKLDYTIAADGKMHKVLINQKEVPMLMQFAAVPKVCTDAFLMAKVTGWEEMNIIPGNARLYFDGGYVGEIYLDASATDDTLHINLGRDKSISLTRKKIKENYKEKILADEKIETRIIEIVVRNTKNIPVEIVLEDQIPIVTGTNDIKVELLESDGATFDEVTGKLTWKVKLKVKESEKIKFSYQIKYPKGKTIAGL
jgi:uncharacterized protein (TIGR02231 family)